MYAFPLTLRVVKVPTLVKLEFTTVLFNVFPVKVPALAATVPDAPKTILVPLIVTVLVF